jgi:hypothetical protein
MKTIAALALVTAALPAQAAFYSLFGPSCAIQLLGVGRPVLGTSVQITPCIGQYGLVMVGFGISNTQYAGYSLPLELGPWGSPGCYLLTSIDVIRYGLITGPSSCSNPVTMPIPNNPALAGGVVYAQASMLNPGQFPTTLLVSNGLSINLGY